MRPASLVLLIIGVGLLLGCALVASFKIPCREVDFEDPDNDLQNIITHCNAWGQPLWAVCTTFGPAETKHYIIEIGPYPNGVRQGMWNRVIRELGKPDVTSDTWYLDGREVSAAEWEQRQ